MRHKVGFLFLMLFLITNCGTDDSNDEVDSFSIELEYSNTIAINELLEVTIFADEGFREIKASKDESFDNSSGVLFFDLETSIVRYFSFDKLGLNTIYFRGYNEDGVEANKTLTVNVVRGDALKINTIEMTSFSDINNTWDDEFAETDINRLADVFFLIRKSHAFFSDSDYNVFGEWYRSPVIENQGSLTWDLSEEELYVGSGFPLNFIAADMDEGGNVGDLMLGRYHEYFSFSAQGTQPGTFTFNVPDIDLEFIATVEWPE